MDSLITYIYAKIFSVTYGCNNIVISQCGPNMWTACWQLQAVRFLCMYIPHPMSKCWSLPLHIHIDAIILSSFKVA